MGKAYETMYGINRLTTRCSRPAMNSGGRVSFYVPADRLQPAKPASAVGRALTLGPRAH